MKPACPVNQDKKKANVNNVQTTIPALHQNWKDPRCFTKYIGLTVDIQGSLNFENYDQWMDETTWFIKDMKYLLCLQYHKFWSTVIYNNTVIESVLSYVQNALPGYLEPKLNTCEKERAFAMDSEARLYVFRVVCRFTVLEEGNNDRIEEKFLAALLYKTFIITVPFILDLIAIYGRDYKERVSGIIEFILTIQPKYMHDFRQGLNYLVNVFTVIQNRCELELQDVVSEASLIDLAIYAHDCAYTLSVMVEISPTLRQICYELNCEFAISTFYENAVLVLYKKIQETDEGSRYLNLLNDTRMELLAAFRSILTFKFENMKSMSKDSLLFADKFISILTECLANNVFVSDYKRHYEIENDFQNFQSVFNSVDEVKLNFIRKAYTTVEDTIPEKKDRRQSCQVPTEFERETSYKSLQHDDLSNNDDLEQQKQQKLQTILSLIPSLDVEQVRHALDRYENVEQALDVLLEKNLSPEGQRSAQTDEVVNIPNDPLDEFYVKTGIDRLNIYDGDEFDVMVNDKVKGIIKRGKGMPGEPKTFNELLDDKSHVQQVRHIYQQYDHIAAFDPDDDEYDDSYDAMAESESRHVKVTKGARNVLVEDGLDNESENEAEGVQEANRNLSLSFCENPETARKRYEEKLNAKHQHRYQAGMLCVKRSEEGDVRGKPKGQGQDEKVLHNRKNKNENKSSVGNHNRKKGASYKRNRGMMPS